MNNRPSAVSLVALAQMAWVAGLALLLTPRWRMLHGFPSGVLALIAIAVVLAAYAAYALVAVRRATRRLAEERRLSATLEQDVAARAEALEDARRVLQRTWWLGQQIALELDPERVLERFLEAVVDITQADGGVVALLGEGEMLRVVAANGVGQPFIGCEIPAAASVAGRVVRSGRAWTAADVCAEVQDAHEPTLAALREAGVHGLAMLPLARRGERIGIVAIGAMVERTFTQRALEQVTAMADLLSMALANAELVETLRRAEWRFRTLFRAAPDAVFTVLQSGRIREANDAVRDVTGIDPHQVVGRAVVELVAENDREKLATALERSFTGSPERLEVVMVSALRPAANDDSRTPRAAPAARKLVSLAISPLREADPPSVLVIGRDVTSEREMRVRLMESDRLAAVGELVAGVAHEVNNPLSSISAFAQLLLRDAGLTDGQRECVDVIRAETTRASQVVKDLLAFARRSAPQRELLDINGLVSRTLRMRSYQLGAHEIALELDLAADLPATIGDARQLQQVFLNLVTNAIQAMASMGAGRLVVSTRREGDVVMLEMRDTGPGISEDARAHIFEPFFTTKREGEGTGLGLSVSYGIIAAHGGSIEVAETSSAGTTFRVSLPAASTGIVTPPGGVEARAPVVTPVSSAAVERRRESTGFTMRSPLSGVRLLCVEPDVTLRTQLETYGALRGFTVVSAADGRAALDVVLKTGVDAVVCSVRAWNVDGTTLLDHLRRDRPGLAPRTILVTEDGDPAVVRGALGAFARQPILAKPYTCERLEEMLITALRGGSPAARR